MPAVEKCYHCGAMVENAKTHLGHRYCQLCMTAVPSGMASDSGRYGEHGHLMRTILFTTNQVLDRIAILERRVAGIEALDGPEDRWILVTPENDVALNERARREWFSLRCDVDYRVPGANDREVSIQPGDVVMFRKTERKLGDPA